MHNRYNRFVFGIAICAFVLLALPALAQDQDTRVAPEPTQGHNTKQHWPGVMVRGGTLYVRWGELRPTGDTVRKTEELFYVLGDWSRRTEVAADTVAVVKPEVLMADASATAVVSNVATRSDPREFDGATVAGSMQWRGDLVPISGGNDTVRKASFNMYLPVGGTWKKVNIYQERRSKEIITLRSWAYAYDPNRAEILCAWVSSVEPAGFVTCVDTTGVVRWSFNNIPLPNGRYNLLPLGDREFVVIRDSFGIRYKDGSPRDTTMYSMPTGQRFQRILGDRFLRTFIGPDTAHYTIEMYSLAGAKLASAQVFRPNAQPRFFITENREDSGIGFIAACDDGVYATVLDKNLNERMPVRMVSRGTDSAFSPSAAFFGDTLYTAWQDNRNTVPDIYGRAFATGTFVFGVDAVRNEADRLAIDGVVPNPANDRLNVRLVQHVRGALRAELVNAVGAVARVVDLGMVEAGPHTMEFAVAGLPAGAYRVVVRGAMATASAPVVIIP